MRSTVAIIALVAVACTTPTTTPTTIPPSVTTTANRSPVTATAPTQDYQVQNCATPPVMFVPLCEMWELLEDWHVDRPLDPLVLADLAVEGLVNFDTEDTEPPPRTLFCAVPHEAFVKFCEQFATEVLERQIPLAPAVEAATAHMVDVGLGPFTYYVPPGQRDAFRLNGVVGGIGVLLDARDAAGSKCARLGGVCVLEVVTVLEDNPGFEAGLMSGDVIISVNGDPVDGQGFSTVVAQIAGDESGTVDIKVDRDGQVVDFEIERAVLETPTVEIQDLGSGVGYIRIPDFEWDIPTLVANALDELVATGPGTIVVDLRDNPGGFVDAVVSVADMFISDGIVMVSDGPNEHLEYPAGVGGRATSQRLVVLVNSGTASAAEILTGALRDRRSAVVVGTDTFGKDAVQIPFSLRNDGEFYVVVARWSSPNGETAEGDGLQPDVHVEWPEGASVEEIVDLALEAAS